MNSSTQISHEGVWSPLGALGRWRAGWVVFWFTPTDPLGLHTLRFLAGLLFLFWLAPLAGEYQALFGLNGWLDRRAYEDISQLPGGAPFPVGWSLIFPIAHDPMLLQLSFWGSLAVLTLFTLGVATRITGILTWLIVVSHIANPALHYDADYVLVILAFYLMVAYVLLGQWSRPLSLVERILGPREALLSPWRKSTETPSYAANFIVRLIQVHFALIVLTSALHKLQFGEWWSGAALWYWLYPAEEMTPEIARSLQPGREGTLFFISLGSYAVLAWQLTFPWFAFRPRWRPFLLAGALVGWIGSVLVLRLPYFGPLYFLACLSYLTPTEWAWIMHRLRRETNAAPTESVAPAVTKFRPRVNAGN